jgi:hypothetical protein
LEIHEELASILLSRAKEMAVVTHLYQDILDDNLTGYEIAFQIGDGVRLVSGAVESLADFNRQLNEHYAAAIREVCEYVPKHPARKLVESSSRDLQRLHDEVSSITYDD